MAEKIASRPWYGGSTLNLYDPPTIRTRDKQGKPIPADRPYKTRKSDGPYVRPWDCHGFSNAHDITGEIPPFEGEPIEPMEVETDPARIQEILANRG